MSLVHIPSEIRDEFTVGSDGSVTVSRRGVARLCGVDEKSIRLLLERVKGAELKGSVTLQSLAGQSFKGAEQIPDTVAACIVNYYAHEAGRYKTKQALSVALAFSAIGLRSWVQNELGWVAQPVRRDDLRLSSTEVRKETMEALQKSGFNKTHHYINVTQMVYRGLFGMDAAQLRKARGLADDANVRDHLTVQELGMVRALEIMMTQALVLHVFTSSTEVNQYVRTIAGNMQAVGSVDPKAFIRGGGVD